LEEEDPTIHDSPSRQPPSNMFSYNGYDYDYHGDPDDFDPDSSEIIGPSTPEQYRVVTRTSMAKPMLRWKRNLFNKYN
jgi:hypothetical protein